MRIHASGTGPTIEEAMKKVRTELIYGARLAGDPAGMTEINGQKLVDPEKQRVSNPSAASMESAVYTLAQGIEPQPGYLFRVLVVQTIDGINSSGRVEVDLIRA